MSKTLLSFNSYVDKDIEISIRCRRSRRQ